MRMQKNKYWRHCITVILPFILLFFMQSLAFAGLRSVTPPVVGETWQLKGVSFPSADEGWTVGGVGHNSGVYDTGMILHYSLPTLTVTTSGTGTGTVTSVLSGIDCRAVCTGKYKKGTKVTLTPVPDSGSIFTGWSGDCKGTGACTVTLSGDKSVGADFEPGQCTYTIAPKNKTLTYKGGRIAIAVTAKDYAYCPAPTIANNNPDWIAYTTTPFTKDKGTIKLTIPELDSSIERIGTLTIGGNTFTLTQQGEPCTMKLSASTSTLFPNSVGTGLFNISITPSDCAWTASPDVKSTWVHITNTSSSEVDYSVDENTGTKARSGKIDVTLTLSKKSKVYTVKQGKAAESGQLRVVTMYSPALKASRSVKIYTPYGYNSETKYPVLYMLHGYGYDINQWMPELGMNLKADQMIRDKKITPIIIVAPQMDNSFGASGNEDFLCKELIQYIDSNFSTNPTRENRFIGGLSMGGFIALHNAFIHTDLFSKVGGHSAYLYTQPNLNASIENPIATARYKDLTMLKVYLDTGTSDEYNLTVCLSELFGILQSKGVVAEYHPGPGRHDAYYWANNVKKYLKFYAGI